MGKYILQKLTFKQPMNTRRDAWRHRKTNPSENNVIIFFIYQVGKNLKEPSVGEESPQALSHLVHYFWRGIHQFLSRLYIYGSFDPVNSAFKNLFHRNAGKIEQR